MIDLHMHNGTIELFGLAHHPKRKYMDLDSPQKNLQKYNKHKQFNLKPLLFLVRFWVLYSFIW